MADSETGLIVTVIAALAILFLIAVLHYCNLYYCRDEIRASILCAYV